MTGLLKQKIRSITRLPNHSACLTTHPARPLHVDRPTDTAATCDISNRQRHSLAPFHHPDHHTAVVKQLLLREATLFQQGDEQLDREDATVDGVKEMEGGWVCVGKGPYCAWIQNYSVIVEVYSEGRGNILEFIESKRIRSKSAHYKKPLLL